MDTDFSFSNLNPDLILDAIESVGLEVTTGLLALNSYENRVYQFAVEGGKRFVVKFYRPMRWTNAQIQEEHDFAWELASNEIPIIAPSKFDGQTLLVYAGFRFAIFPSTGGRQFEVDNLDQIEWMGRFIGRIHMVAKSKHFTHRPALDTESFLVKPKTILTQSQLLPSQLTTSFMTILDMVIELASKQYQVGIASLSDDKTTAMRLHGDCHPGNILWRDGPTFVDLDDCRTGPAVQDLWMMLSGDNQQQYIQMSTLIEAYEEFQTFDTKQLALIEPLRAMRMVHYMAWLSDRWQDPAFPQAFPWFAENKYWENQILALKEQYSALQAPPLSLKPLSNMNSY